MTSVRMVASAGLALIILAHAILLGLVMHGLQTSFPAVPHIQSIPVVSVTPDDGRIEPPIYPQMSAPGGDGLNTSALGSGKKQAGPFRGRTSTAPCWTCQQPYTSPAPYNGPYAYPSPQPNAQPYAQPIPGLMPAGSSLPKYRPLKLALFLNDSPQSHEVLQWFSRNEYLRALKGECEFQVYKPGDSIYQQRYAHVVAPSAMPAIIVSYKTAEDIDSKQATLVMAMASSDIRSESQLARDCAAALGTLKSVEDAKRRSPPSASPSYPLQYLQTSPASWPGAPAPSWNMLASPPQVLYEAGPPMEGDPELDCSDGYCRPRQPLFQPDTTEGTIFPRDSPHTHSTDFTLEIVLAAGIVILAAFVGLALLFKPRS